MAYELLELHARDFLIRAYDFVSYLHHELKGNVRFFHRDHYVVNVAAVTLQQVGNLLLGASMKLFNLVDGLGQHRTKVALAIVRARSRRGPELIEVGECREI